MHNRMCCLKLTCLLCACDQDFESDYRRSTVKKTNVSFNNTQFRKEYIWNTGPGTGATGVHRAFSDGPPRGKEEHKMHNSICGRKLTCLLCACDQDFLSNCRRHTSKKTNVGFNKTQKENLCQLHQNGAQNAQQYVLLDTYMLALQLPVGLS